MNHRLPKERSKPLTLTTTDTSFLQNHLSPLQKQFDIVFGTDFRYLKKTQRDGVIVLTHYFVFGFSRNPKTRNLSECFRLHLSEVTRILSDREIFAVIETASSKLTTTSPQSLQFAQLLYRNYTLSYPLKTIEIRTTNPPDFPPITLSPSPTQSFQFAYSANCSLLSLPYNHSIVRYFHSLLLTSSTIIDLSIFPLNCLSSSMCDTFSFVKGVYCESRFFPGILDQSLSFFQNLNMVHLSDCGINEYTVALKHNSIVYWNISRNPLKNFDFFCDTLSFSKKPVVLIDVSHCEVTAAHAMQFFKTLSGNVNLHYIRFLRLGGMPLNNTQVLASFEEYLESKSEFEELDLSFIPFLDKTLDTLVKKKIKVKKLVLKKSTINSKSSLNLIELSTYCEEIDFSETNIEIDTICEIMCSNPYLNTVNLSKLNLTGFNLLPVYRAFLNSDLSKWRSISLEENFKTEDDLNNLIPLFGRMNNLEELKLGRNFLSSRVLSKLLKSTKVTKLSIRDLANPDTDYSAFLDAAMNLKQIDMTGVKLNQLSGVQLTQIANQSRSLESLTIDNNQIYSIETLELIVNAVSGNRNLIAFGFPLNDAKKAQLSERDLNSMQLNVIERIAENRVKKNLLPAIVSLPYEVEEILRPLGDYDKSRLLRHSCVSEVFGLPYPFKGEPVRYEEIDIGCESIYNTPEMAKYVIESEIPVEVENIDEELQTMYLQGGRFDETSTFEFTQNVPAFKKVDLEEDTEYIETQQIIEDSDYNSSSSHEMKPAPIISLSDPIQEYSERESSEDPEPPQIFEDGELSSDSGFEESIKTLEKASFRDPIDSETNEVSLQKPPPLSKIDWSSSDTTYKSKASESFKVKIKPPPPLILKKSRRVFESDSYSDSDSEVYVKKPALIKMQDSDSGVKSKPIVRSSISELMEFADRQVTNRKGRNVNK